MSTIICYMSMMIRNGSETVWLHVPDIAATDDGSETGRLQIPDIPASRGVRASREFSAILCKRRLPSPRW